MITPTERRELCTLIMCLHMNFLDLTSDSALLHIEVRLPVLLCAVKTAEGDFRFCWTISPNVG